MDKRRMVINYCEGVLNRHDADHIYRCEENLKAAQTGERDFIGCPNNYGLPIDDIECLCFLSEYRNKKLSFKESVQMCKDCWTKALN